MVNQIIKDITESTLVALPLKHLSGLRKNLNTWLLYEPIILIGATALTTHIYHELMARSPSEGPYEGLKRYIFKTAKRIPYVKRKVDEALRQNEEEITANTLKTISKGGKLEHFIQLPGDGLSPKEIYDLLDEYTTMGHLTWEQIQSGSVSGTVYHGGAELTELNTRVFQIATWTNPLHPEIFPGICKMEAEIIRMMGSAFHCGPGICGSVTSGGTESILLAIKTYRDWGREERGIIHPEIIVPRTAHAAFAKGAQYFNLRIKYVKVDEKTQKVDLRSMRRMISKNTVMIVGSAPNYPYGIIDDIEEISKLGESYNIPVHVDACLGGFLLAFMSQAGFNIPNFDFRLKGVKSISADPHKYGYTPKGASLLMFNEFIFKKYQYFREVNWPGGIYASPTMAGSRAGVTIATCWSSMIYFGINGYVDATRRIVLAARKIIDGIRKMPELRVFGDPQMSVVGFTSDIFDIYRVSDGLAEKGWALNNLQFPPGIHFCLTYCHSEPEVAQRFLDDLKGVVGEIMRDPREPCTGAAAVYGMSQKIPDRSLVGEVACLYLESFYKTPKGVEDTTPSRKKDATIKNGTN